MTDLRPARGRLLVRPVDAAESFAGYALVIPAEARERLTANQVEVIAVGGFEECDPKRSTAERKCARAHEVEYAHARDCDCNEMIDTCTVQRRVHAHPIVAGDWLLITPRTMIAGPSPERAEYFVHQDAVLGIFNDEISNAE